MAVDKWMDNLKWQRGEIAFVIGNICDSIEREDLALKYLLPLVSNENLKADKNIISTSHHHIGEIYVNQNDTKSARAHFMSSAQLHKEEAEELEQRKDKQAEVAAHRSMMAYSLGGIGNCLVHEGLFEDAKEHYYEALRRFETVGICVRSA
jgi:tetratricopeptide (TPR) repeat protein